MIITVATLGSITQVTDIQMATIAIGIKTVQFGPEAVAEAAGAILASRH